MSEKGGITIFILEKEGAMPDGDIIHGALSRRYQKPYKQLCEWALSPEKLSWELAKRVKQQMLDCHQDVAPFIRVAVNRLEMIPFRSLFSSDIDWHSEHAAIQNLARFSTGSKRGIGIAVQACQAILNQMQNGYISSDIKGAIYSDFAKRIYNSEFGDAVPETNSHYSALNGISASAQIVDSRLAEIEPLVLRHLQTFADTAAQHDDAKPLSLHLPRKIQKIDDIDLDSSALMD